MNGHTLSLDAKQELPDPAHHRPPRWYFFFFVFLLCCIAFALRWAITFGLPAIRGIDGQGYIKAAHGVPRNIFYMYRPGGYPLLISAFGCNESYIILFQRALSGIAWLCVSLAFARRLRRTLFRWLACVSVFVFGCTFCVTFWDINIMTESISISTLLILVTILLCWDSAQRNLWGVLALVLVSFYFSMLRVANTCFLPALALYLFVLELRAPSDLRDSLPRRAMRILLICLVPANFFFFLYETQQSHRWEDNLTNALNMRVFVKDRAGGKKVLDEENFNYFVEQYAMPAAAERQYAGRPTWWHAKRHTPRYDAWVTEREKSAYLNFLRTHPAWVLRQFRRIGRYYAMNYEWYPRHYHGEAGGVEGAFLTASRVLQTLFFKTLGMLVYPPYAFFMLPLALSALVIWWVHLLRRSPLPPYAEAVATICILWYLASVIGLLAWFGDPDNSRRHMVVGIVSYYLGAVMLLWLLVNLFAERRRRGPSPSPFKMPRGARKG